MGNTTTSGRISQYCLVYMTIQDYDTYFRDHNISDVIFDFDGTLVTLDLDGWPDFFEGIEALCRQHDPAFNFSGKDQFAMQNECTLRFGKPFRDELVAWNKEYERSHYKGFLRHEDRLKILQLPNIRFHLWTGNDRSTVETILYELHISHTFTHIVTRSDVFYGKPHPEGFLDHIYDPAIKKSSYVMLGDAPSDEQAAKAAGISFIRVG